MSPARGLSIPAPRRAICCLRISARRAWPAGRPKSWVGCAVVLLRSRSTRAALFAGTMRAATASELDQEGTTHRGRLPDPNYAPRVRAERLIATSRLERGAHSSGPGDGPDGSFPPGPVRRRSQRASCRQIGRPWSSATGGARLHTPPMTECCLLSAPDGQLSAKQHMARAGAGIETPRAGTCPEGEWHPYAIGVIKL